MWEFNSLVELSLYLNKKILYCSSAASLPPCAYGKAGGSAGGVGCR